MNKNNYLIIGGTSKAGTTSVFEYLSEHPDVCPSFIKQANFFLDKEYKIPFEPIHSFSPELNNYADYDKFYPTYKNEKYQLESSPDYLYSPNTPHKIKTFQQATGNAIKIVFLLRKPQSRFTSYFNFAKQLELIPPNMGLQEYIQANQKTGFDIQQAALSVLETGNYHRYLQPFIDLIGKDNVVVEYFENLKASPQDFMLTLAQKIGIDAEFYQDFSYVRHNQTRKVKNKSIGSFYAKARLWALKTSGSNTLMVPVVRWARKNITPLYHKVNTDKVKTDKNIDAAAWEFLNEYYKNESTQLQHLLGVSPPW